MEQGLKNVMQKNTVHHHCTIEHFKFNGATP